MEHTQGEVNLADGQVPKPSVLDALLGVSSTNTSPHPGKTRVTDFFQWSLKVFYMEHTQGEVNLADGQVPEPSVFDELLFLSST